MNIKEAQKTLSEIIQEATSKGPTLVLLSGGSTVKISSKIFENLSDTQWGNLRITLTDERYGAYNHPDSNWKQLLESGLSAPETSCIPVLSPQQLDRETTAKLFAKNLDNLLKDCNQVIGFFGIGLDSHIAGILPGSSAVSEAGIVSDFDGGKFQRITIAPPFFDRITKGIIYAEGSAKADVFEMLSKDLPEDDYPDQLIKRCQSYTLMYNEEGL